MLSSVDLIGLGQVKLAQTSYVVLKIENMAQYFLKDFGTLLVHLLFISSGYILSQLYEGIQAQWKMH